MAEQVIPLLVTIILSWQRLQHLSQKEFPQNAHELVLKAIKDIEFKIKIYI